MKNLAPIFYSLILFVLACKQGNTNKVEQNPIQNSLKPPVTVTIKNAPVIPAGLPYKVDVPTRNYSITLPNDKKGEMQPPIKTNLEGSEAFGFSSIQNYNVDDGLALGSVYSGCIDNTGCLWFGTQGAGLSCYDGKSFTNYNTNAGLIHSAVGTIIQDKKENLWIATDLGVSCFNGKSFKSYTTKEGLPENRVMDIYEDKKGDIWFATTGGGVSCYDGKSFVNYTTKQGLLNNVVTSILQDRKGDFWFGTGRGISHYNGKIFVNYTASNGIVGSGISKIIEDRKGQLWFGTYDAGVICYDGKSFINYTTKDGLANNKIKCVTLDKKGNIWFGTHNGVSCYDGKTFTTYNASWGLIGTVANCIIEDQAGNLWIGTDGKGINRYDGKALTFYTSKQGLGNDAAWAIVEDKSSNIWLATDYGGVSCYDGKSITTYGMAQGLPADRIIGMVKDKKGDLWFASDIGGAIRYDGKSFITYTRDQGLINNGTRTVLEDKQGRFWICSFNGGVSYFDGKTFTNYTTEQGLASNNIWGAIEDKKGKIWFATDNGLSCYNGKSFTNYTTEQGLSNNLVVSITEDKKGNIWLGTSAGLNRYDGKSFLAYTTVDGLSDDGVFSLALDKQDNLFLGTNLGFTRLVGYEYTNNNNVKQILPACIHLSNRDLIKLNAKPVFEQYHYKNGYPIKDVNSNAMFCDSKGIIWAGTGDKVVRFDPSAINKNIKPLFVVLKNLKVNNENVCWNDIANGKKEIVIDTNANVGANIVEELCKSGRAITPVERDSMYKKYSDIQFDSISRFYPVPQHLVLPYKHNNLTFDFVAIEPARPYLVNYQYILENYDKEWSKSSNLTSVTYNHIPEGTYTFKVKAQSPFGVWSEPVTYTFKIQPPWYRTWWAYIIYVCASFIVLYSIYRWRTAALRKENELLEGKVKERTIQLDASNKELQQQKIELEISQKKVIDSINYAKKIQYSTLPSADEIMQYIPNYFVHFLPKDTISGDFYWFYHNEGLSYIAVADCTGHGVPGALMSMMSYSLLNEVMLDEKLKDPAKILSSLHRLVFKTLQQHKGDEYSQDGLDISLCIIDHSNKLLHFSGARNNVFLVDTNEVTVLKATPRSIGGVSITGEIEPERQFQSETIVLKENTLLIMSTDGIFDQLNNEDEKFGTKHFKELIQSLHNKSMEECKETVATTVTRWMQNTHQQDDLLIMGLVI